MVAMNGESGSVSGRFEQVTGGVGMMMLGKETGEVVGDFMGSAVSEVMEEGGEMTVERIRRGMEKMESKTRAWAAGKGWTGETLEKMEKVLELFRAIGPVMVEYMVWRWNWDKEHIGEEKEG